MRGPQPPALPLTDEARPGLEGLVRRHMTPQPAAVRARIVLAAAGRNTAPLARRGRGRHPSALADWRGTQLPALRPSW